jgi:hypothetical protein
MYVLESKTEGATDRFGSPWWPEATFSTKDAAERWLNENRGRLTMEIGNGVEFRITEE